MEFSVVLFIAVFFDVTLAQISIEPPRGGTLEEGEELSLSCILDDPTFGNVVWYKRKMQLTEGVTSIEPEKYNLTHSSTPKEGLQRFVLHVQRVTKYNHGVYKCRASTDEGYLTQFQKYNLDVLYKPDSKYPFCSVNISEQLAICESEKGNPEIPLQWRYQSTAPTDMEAKTLPIDDFTHRKVTYFHNIPPPVHLDDEITCFLYTQPERNCSISLRNVYESFDPPAISSNTKALATEDVTVSCSTNLNLIHSKFVFQYETFPHNRSIAYTLDEESITFTALPVGVEYIEIFCRFQWGCFDSLTSNLTTIMVIQPTTTPNPLEIPVMEPTTTHNPLEISVMEPTTTHNPIEIPVMEPTTTPNPLEFPGKPFLFTTSSIPMESQSLIHSPTLETLTTHYVRKHTSSAPTTLKQKSTDHQQQVSTHLFSQSSDLSTVTPSSSPMQQTEYLSNELYDNLPLSVEMVSPPKDILTTQKLTTMKYIDIVPSSDPQKDAAKTDHPLPTEVDRLSTAPVSTMLAKTTRFNEIKGTPLIDVDTNPPESLVTDFTTTNMLTSTQHSVAYTQEFLLTKSKTPTVSNLQTEANGITPPLTFHHITPSRLATVKGNSSETTATNKITTIPESLSSRMNGSSYRSTEQAPILENTTDKIKPPPGGKMKTTIVHVNNKENGKGIAEHGTNKVNDDNLITYIAIIITCCGCTLLTIAITIYRVKRKKNAGGYHIDP